MNNLGRNIKNKGGERMALDKNLSPQDVLNIYIARLAERLPVGALYSAEDVKELMLDTQEALLDEVPEELQKLLSDFEKKLEDAKNARNEVEYYLEEHFDFSSVEDYETIEDECEWCYGINREGVKKIIRKGAKA